MVDTTNLYCPPDRRVVERLASSRAGGGHDWLFVGQMLPHKAHQDVIKAFACARRMFDPEARLHLVGRESCPAYADALHRYVSALGLSDAVEFAGSVSSSELSAYYRSADVLVCCSDHEGFCAPLLEAMHYRLAGGCLRRRGGPRDALGRRDRPSLEVAGARRHRRANGSLPTASFATNWCGPAWSARGHSASKAPGAASRRRSSRCFRPVDRQQA